MHKNGAVLIQSAESNSSSSRHRCWAVKASGASRARRGAVAKRPVIADRRIARAGLDRPLFAFEISGSVHAFKKHASQNDEPRLARTASRYCATTPLCPRSSHMSSSAVSARCRRMNIQSRRVRPNTSLQPTRNGMALGPCNAFVYDAPHGPSAMPLRAAELER